MSYFLSVRKYLLESKIYCLTTTVSRGGKHQEMMKNSEDSSGNKQRSPTDARLPHAED